MCVCVKGGGVSAASLLLLLSCTGKREKLKKKGLMCYQVAVAWVEPELLSSDCTLASLFRECVSVCVGTVDECFYEKLMYAR